MGKYVAKPITVEAIEFKPDNWNDVVDFLKTGIGLFRGIYLHPVSLMELPASEGSSSTVQAVKFQTFSGDFVIVRAGQFIVKDIKGFFYRQDKDVFLETHILLDDSIQNVPEDQIKPKDHVKPLNNQ